MGISVLLADLNFQLTGHFLGDRGQRAGFLLLAAFLISFLFIRTSARLSRDPRITWWPGSVKTASGLHIHHLVWGICLLLLSGFLAFATRPTGTYFDVLAVLFGIGAGLTLDEFALWLHLEDVYWADQGRQSVDAVVIAALIGGLVVAGLAPFDTGDDNSIVAITAIVAVNLLFVFVAVLKGRLLLAIGGVFIPLVAIYAAVRLGAPGSRWAKRRYAADSRKLDRSVARYSRLAAKRRRLLDMVGGSPTKPVAEDRSP